jgi:hypothetical protein
MPVAIAVTGISTVMDQTTNTSAKIGKLINIDPANLKKYLYEYAVIGLTASVVFLFFAYRDLNNYIIKNLIEQKSEMIRTVEKNTAVIQEFVNNQKQNK